MGDITTFVPNASANNPDGDGRPRWYIRGLGTGDTGATTVFPLGIYADDVYLNAPIAGGGPLFDLERIEILRGPQGTLYGKNTTAGAVNVISKKPTFDTDGYGTVGFGSKNERIVTGAIGGALVDERLAGRVALYSEERDGFQSNDFDGNTYGDVNKKAIRLQFLAQLNPDLDALLKLHSRRFKGDGSNGSLPVGRYYNVGYARKNTRITGLDDVGSIPGNQIIGRNTQGLIEDGTPEDKLTLSANWLYDGWSVTVAQRRYGEWKNRNAANPTLDQTFSPQWVTDLDVSYRFDLGLTLSAGAINLFDSHPDKAKGAQLYGVPKYSITSPEGAQGAFYYTSVSYDF